MAFAPQNIESSWAKAGLYPPDRDRVLRDIQRPPTLELKKEPTAQDNTAPPTPVTLEDLASLRRILEQNIDGLEEESRLYFCKLANAGERAMTRKIMIHSAKTHPRNHANSLTPERKV